MVLGFGLGLGSGMMQMRSEESPGWNTVVRVRGVVDEVRTHPGRRISISAKDVVAMTTNATLPGRLLWTWESPPYVPHAGQEFETELRIKELRGRANFGLSSSEEHWRRLRIGHRAFSQGQVPVIWKADDMPVRGRLLEQVSALAPANQGGATIRALLFGDRLLLETDFMDRIRRAGLSHSLALSGLHLSLVASFGYCAAWAVGWLWPGLLLRLPRQKLGVFLALPLVLVYLWLGDFSSSLMRASLMLGSVAMHLFLGSRSHPQDSLFVAVTVLVLLDPTAAYDLSLQLSVLAVFGIILFMPVISCAIKYLRWRSQLMRPVQAMLMLGAVTVCANLFILPVQVLYFSELAANLWLNLLWLPVLSFAVLPLSFLGLAALFLPPAVSEVCFYLAAWGAEVLDQALRMLDCAGLLDVSVVLRPQGVQVVGYGVVLVAGRVLLGAPRPQSKPLAFLGLGLFLMLAPAVWQEFGRLRGEVELTVLDTGMSQSVYVRGSSGATVLVDGGGGWGADYDPGRALVGPALAWNHPPRVDGVVLTHVDSDHVRGLFYILDAFDIGWFGWSGLVDHTKESGRLEALLEQNRWPVRKVRAGDVLVIEPGLWFEVLHPSVSEQGISENETSLVLRLVWKGRGLALVPGDAEKRALGRVMLESGSLQSEVLILPHHGSKSSLQASLYERVGAAWAVAACGPANRFGFPHPTVVSACEDEGSTVMTTADHGAVRFLWQEGREVVVQSARFGPWPGD
jgi:competence protein ComEC